MEKLRSFFITVANWRETGSIFRSATCPQGGCALFPQWKPCSQPCVNARLCTPTQKMRIRTTITKGRSTTLRHAVRKSCFFWGKQNKTKTNLSHLNVLFATGLSCRAGAGRHPDLLHVRGRAVAFNRRRPGHPGEAGGHAGAVCQQPVQHGWGEDGGLDTGV